MFKDNELKPAPRIWLANYIKLVLSFCAFGLVGATLYFEAHNLFAMPLFDDMFDRLRMYRSLGDTITFIKYLFAPHNEHRILTTRLLALLDEDLLGGKEYVQVTSSHVLQFLSSLLAYHAFSRVACEKLTIGARVLLYSALVLLFINPNFLYTLLVPFQVQHAIMEMLCVLAALMVSGASEKEDGPALTDWRFLVSLLALAVVASFTLGNGPVILLTAAACAIVLRWRLTTTLALIALAMIHTALVFGTTEFVGQKSYAIAKVLNFALVYLGSPFLRFDPWPASYATYATSHGFATAAGAVVLATGVVFALARLFKPGLGGSLAVFGLALIVIVIASGLAGGLSRAQFGLLEGGNKKYASFAALGWVGCLAIYISLLRAWFVSWSIAVEAVSVVALLLLVPLSAIGFEREARLWQKETERNWEAAIAVLLKVNTPALNDIYQPPTEIADYVRFVDPLNRGVFAQFRYRWGDDAPQAFARMRATTCRGSAQDLMPIPSADRPNVFDANGAPMKMNGWAWIESDHAPAATVIAVDPKNHIVGLAKTTRPSETAEEWLSQKFDRDVGWFGFARVEETPLRFFAISRNGRRYCELGGVGDVR